MGRRAILLEYQGQTLTYAEIAALTGQPIGRLRGRRHRGWTDQDIVERPRHWWPGRAQAAHKRGGFGAAIAAYLEQHPEEAQRLAEKYNWTEMEDR